MTLSELLRDSLERADAAGVRGVRKKHLTAPQWEQLLHDCILWLRWNTTGPSELGEGWRRGFRGMRPWWEQVAGLTFEEGRRVRPLRMDVYDDLEERGLIIKPPGQGSPIHIAPWADRVLEEDSDVTEMIGVTSDRAWYGDPLTNLEVEAIAMKVVSDSYRKDRWVIEDVTRKNCGWDLTATRSGEERHLEVKGVTGAQPRFLLTRNEFDIASRDPSWRLAIVTSVKTLAKLAEYEPDTVLAASQPHVYRVRLDS